jgi:hypothetical protein
MEWENQMKQKYENVKEQVESDIRKIKTFFGNPEAEEPPKKKKKKDKR